MRFENIYEDFMFDIFRTRLWFNVINYRGVSSYYQSVG